VAWYLRRGKRRREAAGGTWRGDGEGGTATRAMGSRVLVEKEKSSNFATASAVPDRQGSGSLCISPSQSMYGSRISIAGVSFISAIKEKIRDHQTELARK
jgi:hypothetical protein